MADTKQLIVELTLQNKGFQKALTKAKTTFNKAKGAIVRGIKAIRQAWLALGASFTASFIIFRDLAKAYAKQEKAEKLLQAAFSKTSKNAKALTEDFKQYASGLQQVTKFGDEQIIQAAAQLQSLAQLDSEGLKKAIKSTLDLATAQGIDLNSAALLVGKTIGSSTNALARYGIQVREGGTETERLESLVGALQEKFGGLAEAEGKTLEGQLQQTANAFGDLKEELGKGLLPVILPVVKGFAQVVSLLQKLPDSIQSIVAVFTALSPILIGVGIAFGAVGAKVVILISLVAAIAVNIKRLVDSYNELKKAVDTTSDALQDQQKQERIVGTYNRLSKSVKQLKGDLVSLRKELSTVSNGQSKAGVSAKVLREQIEATEKLLAKEEKKLVSARVKVDRFAKENKKATAELEAQAKVTIKADGALQGLLATLSKAPPKIKATGDASTKAADDFDDLLEKVVEIEEALGKTELERQTDEVKRNFLERQKVIDKAQSEGLFSKVEADTLKLKAEQEYWSELEKIYTEEAEKLKQAEQKRAEEAIETFETIAGVARDIADTIGQAFDIVAQKETAALEREKEARLANLENANEFRQKLKAINEQEALDKEAALAKEIDVLKTSGKDEAAAEKETELEKLQLKRQAIAREAELEAEREKIESEFARKSAEKEKERFNFEKGLNIGRIIIEGLVGVAKAVAANPVTLGLPQSAIIAGGAAAAAITAGFQEPPALPAFQRGGQTPGGSVLVGEAGPEIIRPPANSTVVSNNEISNNMQPNMVFNINTSNGQEVVRTINNYFRQFGTPSRGVAF
jgi:hypothetical protein